MSESSSDGDEDSDDDDGLRGVTRFHHTEVLALQKGVSKNKRKTSEEKYGK